MTELATQVQLATVADRLRGARRRGFVGRAAELELFRTALEAPEPPFSVLWIYGPGGVGKTTLLGALADAARAAGRDPVALDLRGIEPSPPAFTAELAPAAQSDHPVLLLDTFETAAALEDLLREQFVPGLPAGALVVVASRARPGDAWRADPGWRELLRVVSLRNLDPEDGRALLRGAGVAGELFMATTTRPGFRLLLRRGNRRGLPRPFVDRMYDDFDRATRKAVLQLYRSVPDVGARGERLARELRALDRPALVLWGRRDPYLRVAHAERQREAFPRAEVRVLEGSGHWPFVDEPAAVSAALRAFLARHARDGSAVVDRVAA